MKGRRRRMHSARRITAALALLVLAVLGGLDGATAQTAPATSPPGTMAGPAPASTPQRTVRVAVTELDPFVIKHPDNSYGGFAVELWEEIAKRNDYRTVYVAEPNREGTLDAVKRGDADLAVGDITVTSDLVDTFDFTEPTLNSGLQIMVAEGQSNPFAGLWHAVTDQTVLLLLGIMAVTVGIAAVLIWLLERRTNPDFAPDARGGVAEGTWWASVTMFAVGYGDSVPRTGVGRIFSVLWMICGMLLVAAVTATFAANLTVRQLQTDIHGPDDLRTHEIVTVKDSTAATYLADHKIATELVDNPEDMVAAVRNGDADAAVFDAPLIAHAVHESDGNLGFAGPQFTHSYNAFALRPGGGMRAPIDTTLLHLLEDGTYNRLYRSYFTL
jgi:polar amino acid transport system substrate-binding protein